jgi:cell wall-associated NlpC family hydrolase
MTAYFESETAIARFRTAAESWERTPWAHRCGVKGVGADCVFFVLRVLEETGYLPAGLEKKIPPYGKKWFLAPGPPILMDAIPKFAPQSTFIDKRMVKDGDLIVYQMGRHMAHLAIVFGPNIFHSVFEYGVKRNSRLDPYWKRREILGVKL